MDWILRKFDELDVHSLYEVLKLRADVFVVEQNCVYPDLDTYDQQSLHLTASHQGEIVAYCRILPPGVNYDYCSIGRVIVKASARGQGIAKELMEEAIKQAELAWQVETIQICAQSHLQKFYGSLGFESISDEFDEDGIPHVYMIRNNK